MAMLDQPMREDLVFLASEPESYIMPMTSCRMDIAIFGRTAKRIASKAAKPAITPKPTRTGGDERR